MVAGGSYAFVTAKVSWKRLEVKADKEEDGIPQPRYLHTAYLYGSTMYIYGGFNIRGVPLNDVWRFSTSKYNPPFCRLTI